MRHPTYASVTATLALVVALGGTGYAAAQLPKNSVGSGQIKANAVKSVDVKDGSLVAKDFAAGQLPAGATGATGPTGATGAAGTPATKYFAHVDNDGTVAVVTFGTAGISAARESTGAVDVTFPAPVSSTTCAFTITPNTDGALGFVRKSFVFSNGATIYVETRNTSDAAADYDFDIIAFC